MATQTIRLARLNARHRLLIRMLADGKDNKEIYAKTKYTGPALCRLKKCPLIMHELAKAVERKTRDEREEGVSVTHRAKARLDELSLDAADGLGELLNSKDERVKLAAAEAVLDRTLPRKVAEGPAGNFGLNITAETVNLFQKIVAESDSLDSPVGTFVEGTAKQPPVQIELVEPAGVTA